MFQLAHHYDMQSSISKYLRGKSGACGKVY